MSLEAITVKVKTEYLPQQSKPDQAQFAFAYHITIYNQSDIPAQLLGRHWIITDANEAKQEVRGAGVVG